MFIIEGSDCLGKTTVANQFVDFVNQHAFAYYQHMTKPPANFDYCYDYLDMISKFAVMDRFHLGAIAYQDNRLHTAARRFIEGHLLQVGSVIVIMYCSDTTAYVQKLTEHAEKRTEMFSIDKMVAANEAFIKLFTEGNIVLDFAYNIWDKEKSCFQYPGNEDFVTWNGIWRNRLSVPERSTQWTSL